MADLGAPVTTKFEIGTVETRIGPLSMANKLTQANSLGLLDNAQIQVQQQETDLEGGFPQRILDSAITSETTQLTATLREFSQRNVKLLLGQGIDANPPTNFSTTVAAAETAGSMTLDVASGGTSSLAAGDLIVAYAAGAPETAQILRIESISSGTISLDSGTPLLTDLSAGDLIYRTPAVPIGGLTTQKYVSVQVISIERGTGRPTGYNFWKGSVSGGLDITLGGTDFASTQMTIKLLEPAAVEYGANGALSHLGNIIPKHPIGLKFGTADS